MTDPEDVFGEEFVQHVQERTAERRQERNQLTEEQLAKVAHLAVNEGKFEEGDPQFTFTTTNGITHNVLYAELPDPDGGEVWEHLSEPWDGAARVPLEYLGQWYWSTFPNKKDVANLKQGDTFIVVGSVDTSEGDDGEKYYNIYPVRATLQLDEAQEMAEAYDGDGDFNVEDTDDDFSDDDKAVATETETKEVQEEPEPEVEAQDEDSDTDDTVATENGSSDDSGGLTFDNDSSDSSSGGGLDGLVDDDEEEDESASEDEEPEPEPEPERDVPYDDIAAVVEEMAEAQDPEEEPQVYEIEEGTDHHKRFTEVICNKLGLNKTKAVAEVVMDVIDEHREEEENDDDTTKLF